MRGRTQITENAERNLPLPTRTLSPGRPVFAAWGAVSWLWPGGWPSRTRVRASAHVPDRSFENPDGIGVLHFALFPRHCGPHVPLTAASEAAVRPPVLVQLFAALSKASMTPSHLHLCTCDRRVDLEESFCSKIVRFKALTPVAKLASEAVTPVLTRTAGRACDLCLGSEGRETPGGCFTLCLFN